MTLCHAFPPKPEQVKAHAMERSMMFLDKVEEVLVEKRNIKNPLQVMGRTRLNRQVSP